MVGASRPGRALVLVLSVLLGACASTPTVMRWQQRVDAVASARVWPPAPEIPRYRYVGQLTGEDNFGPVTGESRSVAVRVLRWLAGIGATRAERRVLLRPQSGAADPTRRRVYVSDAGRQALFVFDEEEGRLLVWEEADAGERFLSPVGVALGPDGSVLVADSRLGRVVRLDPDGRPLGSIGAGSLRRPTGLARDAVGGRLYVADTGAHAVKVFDDAGRPLGEIGTRGSAPGEFNAPTHLAFADDRLYVSDTLNARVQVLGGDGEFLREIGRRGRYVGNLARAKGVTVDADGNVYVIESYHDHVLVFDAAGRFLLPIGGTGAAVGEFYLPAGAWSDALGRVYVADMFNGRVFVMRYLGADPADRARDGIGAG